MKTLAHSDRTPVTPREAAALLDTLRAQRTELDKEIRALESVLAPLWLEAFQGLDSSIRSRRVGGLAHFRRLLRTDYEAVRPLAAIQELIGLVGSEKVDQALSNKPFLKRGMDAIGIGNTLQDTAELKGITLKHLRAHRIWSYRTVPMGLTASDFEGDDDAD